MRRPPLPRLRRSVAGSVLLTAAVAVSAVASPAVSSARAAPKPGRVAAVRTPLPQHDPFYQPPAGYGSTPPGTILRSRPVNLAYLGFLPQNAQAWQLLYRTTNRLGKPMATVTTVVRPSGPAPAAVVSYQIAEDASAPQCAPSYALQPGVNPGNAVNQVELAFIDAVVADGFAVSIPDYEGPDGEFGAARQPGYAILDGLRAAEQFGPLGLPGATTPAAIWGYSGGALASGWAAQVQPGYAPDVRVRGIALGGYPTNLEQPLVAANGGVAAGLIPSVLPGVLRADPALAKAVDPFITPAGQALLAQAGSQCETTNVTRYAFFNINNYLTEPLATILALPAVKKAIAQLSLGGTAPAAPLFVYHAVNDELVPVSGTDATVASYCAGGDSVTYYRDNFGEHASEVLAGGPDALNWLSQRLTGGAVPHGCTTSTVASMLLVPPGLAALPSFLVSVVTALLGLPIGPGSFF